MLEADIRGCLTEMKGQRADGILKDLRQTGQIRQPEEMAEQTVGQMTVAAQVTVRDMVRALDAMGVFKRLGRMPVEGRQQQRRKDHPQQQQRICFPFLHGDKIKRKSTGRQKRAGKLRDFYYICAKYNHMMCAFADTQFPSSSPYCHLICGKQDGCCL